jgi:hypothetical protein
MDAIAGVFKSRVDAERTAQGLESLGLSKDDVVLLTPGHVDPADGKEQVPTSDTEQPGMGAAVGGVVGGAVGVAGGTHLGAAMLTATIPGVGPVIAIGLLGGAVLGLAGARLGSAVEDAMSKGLPADELFLYEDALRQGRSVVIALAKDDKANMIREAFRTAGAETIDAARKRWWIGLRDVEKEHYRAGSRTFEEDEPSYRLGFEAALNTRNLDKGYDQLLAENKPAFRRNGLDDATASEAFRRGYERGLAYHRSFRDKAA